MKTRDVEDCTSAYLKDPEAFAIADGLLECYQIPKGADWYTSAAQGLGLSREEFKRRVHLNNYRATSQAQFYAYCMADVELESCMHRYGKTLAWDLAYGPDRSAHWWARPHDYVGPNKFNMRNADYRTVKAGEKLEAGQLCEIREDDLGDAVVYAWRSHGCVAFTGRFSSDDFLVELAPERTTVVWTPCNNTITIQYQYAHDKWRHVNEQTNGGSWSQRKEAEQRAKRTLREWLTKEGHR